MIKNVPKATVHHLFVILFGWIVRQMLEIWNCVWWMLYQYKMYLKCKATNESNSPQNIKLYKLLVSMVVTTSKMYQYSVDAWVFQVC
jgi:hypothetical protein